MISPNKVLKHLHLDVPEPCACAADDAMLDFAQQLAQDQAVFDEGNQQLSHAIVLSPGPITALHCPPPNSGKPILQTVSDHTGEALHILVWI